MNESKDYHTKWSKSEKNKYNDITYLWNLKYDTNELIYKIERLTEIGNKLNSYQRRKGWGKDKLGPRD